MSQPVTVERPPHKIDEMVTYELEAYRRSLKRAVEALPEGSPERSVYLDRYQAVLAEQADRRRIAREGVPGG